MKRTIKSPTLESGASIQSRGRESIRYDYTLLSSICNKKPTIFYIDDIIMSNQNQQAIHALKIAVSSENLKHHDNNHSMLEGIKNASVSHLVNKEVAYLQDKLERHYDDIKTISEPQKKEK